MRPTKKLRFGAPSTSGERLEFTKIKGKIMLSNCLEQVIYLLKSFS